MRNKIFSNIAHRYDDFVGTFDYDKIATYLPLMKDELILDLGGGTGRVSKDLANNTNGCIILDLSYKMLLQAKMKSRSMFLIQGLSQHLPFRKKSLKQIFLNDSLHHIAEQEITVQDCFNVLDSKGKLIIREYDKKKFRTKILILFEKIVRFGSKFLSADQLSEMCIEQGFEVEYHRPTKSTFILIAEK